LSFEKHFCMFLWHRNARLQRPLRGQTIFPVHTDWILL
jgi:hypothetical protein